MAKIIIEIEDSALLDRVKFTMTPSFGQLANKIAGNHGQITSAEAYGMACANLVMKESKKRDTPTKIILPRLRSMN